VSKAASASAPDQATSEEPTRAEQPPGALRLVIAEVLGAAAKPLTIRQIESGVGVAAPTLRRWPIEEEVLSMVTDTLVARLPTEPLFVLTEAGLEFVSGARALAKG
jgi:hypothetical protein